jgi:hypothetical protein
MLQRWSFVLRSLQGLLLSDAFLRTPGMLHKNRAENVGLAPERCSPPTLRARPGRNKPR